MKKISACVVSMAFIAAFAQAPLNIVTPMPNETDLKSAYCLSALKEQLNQLADLKLAEPAQQRQLDLNLADTKRSVERITLYLVPRLEYLDTTGLMGASKSASQDRAAAMTYVVQCVETCKANNACYLSCLSGNTAGQRIAACKGATFLPF